MTETDSSFVYFALKKALLDGVRKDSISLWNFAMCDKDKEIYKNIGEFVEVRTRDVIHSLAVEYGLMK
jgi:hypothetical protein